MDTTGVTVRESRPWNDKTHSYDDGPITYRVSCSGGTEDRAHGKIYEGPNKDIALLARDDHRHCVQRIDENVAFMFSTVATRNQVTARFMRPDELRKTHGGRKTRVYVDIDKADVPMPRPPYTNRGDDPENDKLWDTYNRWELKAMRLKLSRVRSVMEMFFGQPAGAKFSFSRKAGCTCTCSPGFIMNGQIRADQTRWHGTGSGTPVEIWVN